MATCTLAEATWAAAELTEPSRGPWLFTAAAARCEASATFAELTWPAALCTCWSSLSRVLSRVFLAWVNADRALALLAESLAAS